MPSVPPPSAGVRAVDNDITTMFVVLRLEDSDVIPEKVAVESETTPI
jgi:hypothetical protein